MSFRCLTVCKSKADASCWPADYDTCSPETDICYPDYGLDCRPDGDCDPEDGAEDPS